MSDIFISYYHDDRPHAERLAKTLESAGLTVWWDRTIPAGQSFDQVIERALAESKLVLALWSKQSIASRWVLNEAEEAAGRNILVPVLIEPDVRIPLAFKRIQAANLTDWDGSRDAEAFVDLFADLKQRLAPTAVRPVPRGLLNTPIVPAPPRHMPHLGHGVALTGPLRQRLMLSLLLVGVFVLNYVETAAETALRGRFGLGTDLGNDVAAAFTGLEGHLNFESHDLTNWIAIYGYSASYFLLLPVLGFALGLALWRRQQPYGYRLLCVAVAADYLVSLGFFLFFPVPERWSYADSGAMLLSDLWSSALIDMLRPISGLDNCFPSTHVSFTVILVVVSYLCRVRMRHTMTALGATIVLSTFVLGIHWIPDILAGVATGVLSVGLARRLTPAVPAAAVA